MHAARLDQSRLCHDLRPMQAPGCHKGRWPGAVRAVLDEARRAEVETDNTSLEGR